QQGACAGEGVARAFAHLGARHVVGPPRRPSFGHEPPEGADPRAALQRSEGPRRRGPLEDEQGPAPARRRPAQVAPPRAAVATRGPTGATLGGNMRRVARLFPVGVAVAVALALGSPRSTGAAANHPSTANVRAVQPLLALNRRTFARTGPSAGAAPIRLVSARTALTRSPVVLPVIREATGPAGGPGVRGHGPAPPGRPAPRGRGGVVWEHRPHVR